MRFRNLEGLIDLPIDRVRHRFRHEHVLTVLPVRWAMAGRDSLLVATPDRLVVVTADTRRRDRWMTSLVPWDVVRLGEVESEASIHRLPVRIGRQTLHAELWGPDGERALQDFVVAAGAQHETVTLAP